MMTEEGTLELRIDRVSEYVARKVEIQLFSDPTYIHGFVWRIVAKPSNKSKELTIFLKCAGGDDVPNWSCQASATIRYVSQKDLNDCIIENNLHFSKENDSGVLAQMFCDSLINPDCRFFKDNTVIFRVHVKAEVPQSVRIAKLNKFTSSISNPPDGVLIIGTNRIPIHKTYLSFYSKYFETMFRSEFKEGREDEIVLEDVEYGEMIEMLAVIYPSGASITAWNLKSILKLADRFIMPAVLERCKKALQISSFNGAQKLLLAQTYNFEGLQMEFAQQYKSTEDAMKLRSEPEYNQLNHKTLALLFNSIAY